MSANKYGDPAKNVDDFNCYFPGKPAREGFYLERPMTEIALGKISRILKWLALFCLVGFFFPYFQHTTMQGVNEHKFTLGVPFSPWLIASWTETEERIEKNEDGTIRSLRSGGFSSGVYPKLISWSSLLGVAGFVLLETSRRLRSRVTSQGS